MTIASKRCYDLLQNASVYHKLPQRSLQMRKLYRNTATLVIKYARYYEMLQLRTLFKKTPQPLLQNACTFL